MDTPCVHLYCLKYIKYVYNEIMELITLLAFGHHHTTSIKNVQQLNERGEEERKKKEKEKKMIIINCICN